MKKYVIFMFFEIIFSLITTKTYSKYINLRINMELHNNSCESKFCNPLGSRCDIVKNECQCNACFISMDLPSYSNNYSKTTRMRKIEIIFL